jgi:hypothetical protein
MLGPFTHGSTGAGRDAQRASSSCHIPRADTRTSCRVPSCFAAASGNLLPSHRRLRRRLRFCRGGDRVPRRCLAMQAWAALRRQHWSPSSQETASESCPAPTGALHAWRGFAPSSPEGRGRWCCVVLGRDSARVWGMVWSLCRGGGEDLACALAHR